MANLSSIFLGGVPAEPRKFMRGVFEHLLAKGYKRIHIPCTGQFTIVKTAIEAGFKKENIHSSDVSLFSTVLGYLYSGQPLSEIDFQITDETLYEDYHKAENDIKKAAYLMYAMKICQLRDFVYYERCFIEELRTRKEYYHNQLVELLTENVEIYKGIKYEVIDVRSYFTEGLGRVPLVEGEDIVIMNPPAFTKGYAKMFDFKNVMHYPLPVEEFDFNKEWMNYFEMALTSPIPFLWYTSRPVVKNLPRPNVIFAQQESGDVFSYFLFNRPELLEMEEKYKVGWKNDSKEAVSHYEMLSDEYVFTLESKVTVELVNKETALYYRDLLAHRLGATVSETYMIMFVDGKFMAVAAFNTSFLRRLQETYIFESFCFNVPSKVYENLNRLCMMILLSGEFKKFLYAKVLNSSAYVDLKSMRTTCLSKYRKVKLNNGIMKLESCEKMENGLYKLLYEQPYNLEDTYASCIAKYLAEDVKLKGEKTAVTSTPADPATKGMTSKQKRKYLKSLENGKGNG